MPGWHDDWISVTFSALRRVFARPTPSSTTPDQTPEQTPDQAPGETAETGTTRPLARRLRVPVVIATAGALALTGGGIALAQAHKVVTLDIDGATQQVSTFAGDVDGLLAAQGVELGEHDSLSPAGTTALQDGTAVVVRHGHELTLSVDGTEQTVWSTALSAQDALDSLALRGEDVRLMVSRSHDRAELPVDLTVSGSVDVVADGRTTTVDGAQSLADALGKAQVLLATPDRVQILPSGDAGRLTVLVQRVVVHETTETQAIDFDTETRSTDSLYKGQSRTVTQGVAGERTLTYEVTLVDGTEESRTQLGDDVTTEPVTAVVEVGTKARPVATTSSSSSSTVSGDVWARLAQCESGGNPTAVSSNGLYYGLYQFSLPTWRAMGGSGLPSQASAAEQTQRAQALQARSGWGQWPYCSAKLGLR
ncbi:ubiquitin-like domain-containing protein [Actinotalea sp. M2MS4P-6]|uniref:resuscitation-promoting factor n=1 Tax=Actinotalea sp. M2MS4P-6 TaxID=2983762 RepID=UPI0021E4621C|nr:resuscitation-promoting factor [Actinotalea sp. M2MS4P-6]MCV2395794.1 ubiquitin-like domain-containing protein [Actinotalea sp. M2MS4P-6]